MNRQNHITLDHNRFITSNQEAIAWRGYEEGLADFRNRMTRLINDAERRGQQRRPIGVISEPFRKEPRVQK